MPLIASINGAARKIYLDPLFAVGGVLTFHPTADLYPAYRNLRRTVEAYRPYDALMMASGNEPKNTEGTKRTPRFTRLLQGAKLVIPVGIDRINVTGELLTDDGSDPFDRSLVTGALFIDYAPAEAEIIQVATSGNEYSLAQIGDAVWQHTTGAAVATRLAEAWGRLGLDPTKPLITGNTQITFGDIVMAMAQVGESVTVTRQ